MKRSPFKTVVLVFGITILVTNYSFAQSENRPKKTPPTFSEILKEMDKNDDGKLSASEIKAPLKVQFSKVDADEDGFITEKEFNNAPKPKRRERK